MLEVIRTNPNWELNHGKAGRKEITGQLESVCAGRKEITGQLESVCAGRRQGSLEEAEAQEEHKLGVLSTVVCTVERLSQSH
jgi:hypothetical protein